MEDIAGVEGGEGGGQVVKRFVRAGDLSCAVRLSNVQVDSAVIENKKESSIHHYHLSKPKLLLQFIFYLKSSLIILDIWLC